ncbi:MAG: hypothetical protein LH617_10910 [Ramlibacter sp.]|nr:hypothetical protein [Ramlibacter sp.]
MFVPRRRRLTTVLFALFSLLFMQLAVAGYSCPGFDARVQDISAMAKAGMPCAESMAMVLDDQMPSLCAAHCQSAQPACSDAALTVPAMVAVGNVDYPVLFAVTPPAAVFGAPLLARATPPPLAVRNCCFRI